MINYKELIEEYLRYKSVVWSASTLKSEKARLNKALTFLNATDGFKNPDLLLAALEPEYKPYTLKIILTRLGDLEAWAIMEGRHSPPALLSELLRRCYRRFKGCYQKEKLGLSYDSAEALINSIGDREVRAHALAVLRSGLRFGESVSVNLESRTVVGKGGIMRPVFNLGEVPGVSSELNYQRLRRGLATVGLKPHTLRKLAATKFSKILEPVDLMRVMGWTNMQTAAIYIQESRDEEISAKLMRAL